MDRHLDASSAAGEAVTVERARSVLQRSLDGEVVLYLPATDDVAVLDAVGAAVWAALDEPLTPQALAFALGKRFGQSPERVEQDIAGLLEQLVERGFAISDRSSLDNPG